MSLKKSLLLVLILTLALTVIGCGGGGRGRGRDHKKANSNPYILSPGIKDITVNNGNSELTIITNDSLQELIAIPYNISMTAGNYSTSIDIISDTDTDTNLSTNYSISDSFNTPQQQISDLEYENHKHNQQLIMNLQDKKQLQSYYNYNSTNSVPSYQDGPGIFKFWKRHAKTDAYVEVTATKMYKGSRCLIYLDDDASGSHLTKNNIEKIGKKFDFFCDLIERTFGSIDGSLGDIDGNKMIYILLTELDYEIKGDRYSYQAGYYSVANDLPDEIVKDSGARSNEKEMIYITTFKHPQMTTSDWVELTQAATAHEFQHLIYCNNRYLNWRQNRFDLTKETWINEGLSMIAEDLAMKGQPGLQSLSNVNKTLAYLNNPAVSSLCTWSGNETDYAPAYMFMRYFVDRFGENRIHQLIASQKLGNYILTDASGTSFEILFKDWLTAVAFSFLDHYTTDSRFLYKTLSSNIYKLTLRNAGKITVPDTSGVFISKDVSKSNKITIKISGNPNFKLRLLLFPKKGKDITVTYQ